MAPTSAALLSANDVIKGGLGNDIILGGAGKDTLDGGDGNDRLNSTDELIGIVQGSTELNLTSSSFVYV